MKRVIAGLFFAVAAAAQPSFEVAFDQAEYVRGRQ